MGTDCEWRYVGSQKYKKVDSFQTSEESITCESMETSEIKFTICIYEHLQYHIPMRYFIFFFLFIPPFVWLFIDLVSFFFLLYIHFP